jgi:hypothetical protein
MSIRQTIQTCLDHDQLYSVDPILPKPLSGPQRRFYATPEVFRELHPDTCRDLERSNAGQLRAFISNFTLGQRVTVGSGKDTSVDVKILDPWDNEVWEFRKRETPSTRVFGRFADRNVFIATNMRLSSELFDNIWHRADGRQVKREWIAEIRRCTSTWRQLFPSYEPITGGRLNDYLSRAIDKR